MSWLSEHILLSTNLLQLTDDVLLITRNVLFTGGAVELIISSLHTAMKELIDGLPFEKKTHLSKGETNNKHKMEITLLEKQIEL